MIFLSPNWGGVCVCFVQRAQTWLVSWLSLSSTLAVFFTSTQHTELKTFDELSVLLPMIRWMTRVAICGEDFLCFARGFTRIFIEAWPGFVNDVNGFPSVFSLASGRFFEFAQNYQKTVRKGRDSRFHRVLDSSSLCVLAVIFSLLSRHFLEEIS